MVSTPPTCSNPDCKVADDGKCVETYSLDECPHYGRPSIADIEPVDEPVEDAPPTADAEPPFIPLPLGEALNRADASALQRRRSSRAVGVVGPHYAGKTSLMASVYEILQEGGVAGYSFAGSSTLIGFEMICHDARAASRRPEPHSERTTVGADATFFHLDLGIGQPPAITSLFIGDRSGEDYLATSDELSNAVGFFELHRADVVTVLVDGEHLADAKLRHEVKASTPQLIDALVEAGSISSRHRVAIVLTKKDAVAASPHADRVQDDFDEMVAGILRRHEERIVHIASFVVAASPRIANAVKRGEGVSELVAYWMLPTITEAPQLARVAEMTRMIDRIKDDLENDA